MKCQRCICEAAAVYLECWSVANQGDNLLATFTQEGKLSFFVLNSNSGRVEKTHNTAQIIY